MSDGNFGYIAVRRTPRSKLNDSFGADSGPSRRDSGTPALRPFETIKAAVRYVRNTSGPAVKERQAHTALDAGEPDIPVKNPGSVRGPELVEFAH